MNLEMVRELAKVERGGEHRIAVAVGAEGAGGRTGGGALGFGKAHASFRRLVVSLELARPELFRSVCKGTIMLLETWSECNRMTHLSFEYMRMIQQLHIVVCITAFYILAAIFGALLAIVPMLLEVSSKFELVVGKVAL